MTHSKIESPYPYLSLEDRGYRACCIKQGNDPIPHNGEKQLLPATEEYKRWMEGWNLALTSIDNITDNKE